MKSIYLTCLHRATLVAITTGLISTTLGGEMITPKQPATPSHHSNLWDPHRPDSHAPIGVMGDHTHEAGEIMFSHRFMYMDMRPNFVGSDKVSDRQVITPKPAGEGFLVTPTDMSMEMHMFGLMYAPTDDITLMFMIPWVSKEMDHLRRDGLTFTTRSRDFGDLKVAGLVKIYDANRQRIHLNLGVSAPTGATNKSDFVPGIGNTRLPYPMQIGSGTWDLILGGTYLGQSDHFSWGAQAIGTVRTGTNDQGYTLGNAIVGNVWGAWETTPFLSLSTRFSISSWGNIDGVDRSLVTPPTVVPTADPNLRGGTRVDWAGGVNFLFTDGFLKGARLAFEAGLPLYQDLDGPQLGTDWFLTTGIQKSF
ncbi:MAG: transporter [Verrucomicrobiota bacterium]